MRNTLNHGMAFVAAVALCACGGSGPDETDAGTVAVDGGPRCAASEVMCDDACVDLQTDRDHCGT